MLAVCYRGEISEESREEWPQGRGKSGLCCDASKRDRALTLRPYGEDVFIYTNPSDEALERDINVLNLNGVIRDGQFFRYTKTNLIYHRRQVYQSFKNYLENLKKQIGKT